MSLALEGWSDFNVAMVGATAALAGLLIVAMSVNIAEIMKTATLPARAAAAIATLVVAIVASALGLVPDQPAWAYGLEVTTAALIAAVFEFQAIRRIAHESGSTTVQKIAKSIAGVVPLTAFIIGGVLLLAGAAGAGLAWLAAGSVLAIAAAILYAWVVLVEVLR